MVVVIWEPQIVFVYLGSQLVLQSHFWYIQRLYRCIFTCTFQRRNTRFTRGNFAILGHVYPIYLKFRGGKAVATSAGVMLAVNPILLLILAAIFFAILKLTKYVSLSSIIAAICCVIGSFFVSDYIMLITSFVVAILLIYRHMSNIKRIIKGTEPKIKWM